MLWELVVNLRAPSTRGLTAKTRYFQEAERVEGSSRWEA